MVVEQFLSGFHYGDAIGNSVLNFHNFLVSEKIKSKIVSITIDEQLKKIATPFSEYTASENTIKIYHYAIDSPLNDFFLKIKGKKVMIYHNITPSEYFKGYSDTLVKATEKGRNDLSLFKDKFDLVIADSGFNANELKSIGFNNVKIFPIMISREEYTECHKWNNTGFFTNKKKKVLFVGRISPNKKIEDLIKFVSVYKKMISNEIKLVVAGNLNSVPEYYSSLLRMKSNLNLDTSDIVFTGHLPFCDLVSLYMNADVFLSMSEHEGFCLPLIESSFCKLPVVAFDAGAVNETLNGSGILFREKDMERISCLIERIFTDKKLKSNLILKAEKRAESYCSESRSEKLLKIIMEILDD